ncbi:hypothetical protein GU243_14045 [Pseudarthrobacter psychrotolerans]|uniref:Uncharacterized protein n=1 Tax=Pseudarthrobacter psychrotolerans TaxID=2697569 RepID=A0A6P1NJ56_9MICC|nr:hypothetical protein [Pseudarthrobacter psychrotolerans]QHK20665.1 hypothetical protein GU243_14045 [Pseudarthrobacter psychrotolerans]
MQPRHSVTADDIVLGDLPDPGPPGGVRRGSHSDPSFTFRQHLRAFGGEIEE